MTTGDAGASESLYTLYEWVWAFNLRNLLMDLGSLCGEMHD